MAKLTVSVNTSNVWHPNTQMSEWNDFPEITKAKGVWLYEKSGNKMRFYLILNGKIKEYVEW